MRTFKIDRESGDLVTDDQGNVIMIEGEEEEKQSLWFLLTTNLEEWFLNRFHGLDYSKILVKEVAEDEIRHAVLSAFEQEERVAEVMELDISFERKTRTLTISFVVRMGSGNVIKDEVSLDVGANTEGI